MTGEFKLNKEKQMNELEYAKGILVNNVFPETERPYWTGQSGKNPMGIHDKVWQEASKEVKLCIKTR